MREGSTLHSRCFAVEGDLQENLQNQKDFFPILLPKKYSEMSLGLMFLLWR